MLSAFVLVDPTAPHFAEADRVRAIVKTLGALVELVVADIIADATIVTRPDSSLRGVESSAGCMIVEDADLGAALARALPRARRNDALVLAPGYAPDAMFRAEIELEFSGPQRRPLALVAEPENVLQRLFPALAPRAGLIASRSSLGGVARSRGQTLSSLQRALSTRPMRARALRV